MDPISQGALGASLAQAGGRRGKVRVATLYGCIAGLVPDLDVLIQSPDDPLLFLEFHRQFTHALFFVPFGALIVAALLHRLLAPRILPGVQIRFRESYCYCLLGYATHGLLDACTTYGTQLLWPFSTERFAWNAASIIDPLFTLPILGLIIAGVVWRKPRLGAIAFVWAISYLCFGLLQRDRAVDAGMQLALSRGHQPIRLEAKPGFANLLLWKIVYETEHTFYVDAIRMGTDVMVFTGNTAEKLNLTTHFRWLDPKSQQAKDIERFRWFSNNYLALDPEKDNSIIDVRYSILPNEINPLWAIELDATRSSEQHVEWRPLRQISGAQTDRWLEMLLGR